MKLWKQAEGDEDMFRTYLLDLLLEFFDIDEEKFYANELMGLDLPENIFENEEELSIIKEIQDLFITAPRGSRGIRGKIHSRLLWFIRQTGESQHRILKACKLYINECISTGTYAMSPQNFIYKSEDSRKRDLADSHLWEYIQRLDESVNTGFFDQYAT